MSMQDGFAQKVDCLLEEGLLVTEELCRLEKEMKQLFISMDFQGLANLLAITDQIMSRGEKFIERKRELAKGKTFCKLIEQLPQGKESPSDRYELFVEKLFEMKAKQEVNRLLHEEGSRIAHKMQNILYAWKTTYNSRGEVPGSADNIRHGLDQNC